MAVREKNLGKEYKIGDANTDRGPSQAIWSNCPIAEYRDNPLRGTVHGDDFIDSCPVIAAAKSVAQASALGTSGNYAILTNTAETVGPVDAINIGVLNVFGTTDDKDVIVTFPQSSTNAGMFKVQTDKKFWMECRVAVNSIAAGTANYYIGLATKALGTGALITTSDAMVTNVDRIGWHKLYAAPTVFTMAYDGAADAGTTGTARAMVANDGATVAGDWAKLGMYSDGEYARFYIDGELKDTVALSATGFPQDAAMCFYMMSMGGTTASDSSMYVDWWKIAQEL